MTNLNFASKGFALLAIDQIAIDKAQQDAASQLATTALSLMEKGECKTGGAFRSPYELTTPTFTKQCQWLGVTTLRPESTISNVINGETVVTKSPKGFYAYVRIEDETTAYALVTPAIAEMFKAKAIDENSILTVSLKQVVLADKDNKGNNIAGTDKVRANYLILA